MAKITLNLLWSPKTFFDLKAIHERISNDLSIQRADSYIDELTERIERLRSYPASYAICRNVKLRIAGFRCIYHKKQYIVVYEINGNEIFILGIISAKYNPKELESIL